MAISRAWSLFGLAACWGKPAPTAVKVADAPPPTVAKLFVQGTTWSWPTKIVTTRSDDSGEKSIDTTTAGTLRCEVSSTSVRPGGWNTQLTCKATPELPSRFPTELAATPAGLWELFEGAQLDPKTRLLDEPPQERANEDINEAAEGSTSTSVRKHGASWCFGEAQAVQGHVSEWSLCVRGGELVGGRVVGDQDELITVTWGDHPDS